MINIKPVQFTDVTQVEYMKNYYKHLKTSQYGTSILTAERDRGR